MVDLKALIEAAKAATPGPWDTDEPWIVYSMKDGGCTYLANTSGLDVASKQSTANATFIALANPSTVAAMAEELMALREAVKPFVQVARIFEGRDPQHGDVLHGFEFSSGAAEIRLSDCRRLAAITGATEPAHV